jgi:hypothetical protein
MTELLRRTVWPTALAAVLAAVALAACGGDDDDTSGTDSPASQTEAPGTGGGVTPSPGLQDGCTFATPEVVSEAVGVPIESTVIISEGKARGCAYYTADGEKVIVRVEESELNTADPLATDNPDYIVIDDLAYAFFRPQFSRLEAVERGHSVMVTVQISDVDAQAASTAIALTVAGNLPG